ncbi:tRNA (adenosine(37)-N6)-dimethylallyltransferase MiaA [Pseudochelatococcus sp. G4_1912]|uniref:tRNA (adenosine(37)-N6)-dimethylallyltransferase MiaA n=1 Tax=Pseudochelatococcus sp. G4_1912 TaxID=3114288 RepID=UPI0039C70FD9
MIEGDGEPEKVRAILIAGPTASGKSALAISMAQRMNGVVVNADSMQVYADLRTITARPSVEEEAEAPHRLFGHVDAAENYSVGRWLIDVSTVLDDIWANGKLPIITGGTGLYFKALLEGLSDIPPVPDEIRATVRAEAEARETSLLYADFAARDPETASNLRPTDRQRIIRAMEVLVATGKPLASFRHARRPGLLDGVPVRKMFLAPERAEVNQRINSRFITMMERGALEEVRRMAERNLDPALPAMRAHGVPWLIRYLRGEIGLDTAIAGGQTDTRHYAKRQFTWFRHQLADFEWIAA